MKTILELQTPFDAAPHCLEAIAASPARRTEAGIRAAPHQTMRRILVPVDFTPASVHALHRAASLAERFGTTADEVVHHASCAVLVIPCTDQPQLEPTLWRDSEKNDDGKPLLPAA